MDTDTRTRIECTNWDEAGGPRSCVAVEFHAETRGGADAQERVPPA